jgi:deazaflavin-dependent oxidoreductase (nitroreductase family)
MFLRFYLAVEYFIVTRFLRRGVNPIMRALFRAPILFYRIGLGGMMGKQILLLTTIGRKTGKPRVTALGYGYDAASDSYHVMTGWGGKTDWLRNAQANPKIHVWVGARQFDGVAELVSEEQGMAMMREYARINPLAPQMWSRLSGIPFDGSDESLRKLVAYFPSLRLRPGRQQRIRNPTN